MRSSKFDSDWVRQLRALAADRYVAGQTDEEEFVEVVLGQLSTNTPSLHIAAEKLARDLWKEELKIRAGLSVRILSDTGANERNNLTRQDAPGQIANSEYWSNRASFIESTYSTTCLATYFLVCAYFSHGALQVQYNWWYDCLKGLAIGAPVLCMIHDARRRATSFIMFPVAFGFAGIYAFSTMTREFWTDINIWSRTSYIGLALLLIGEWLYHLIQKSRFKS